MEHQHGSAAFNLQDSRTRFRQKLAALQQVLQKRRADRSSLSASSTTGEVELNSSYAHARRSQSLPHQPPCPPSKRGDHCQPSYQISRSPPATELSPTLPVAGGTGSSSRSPEPCLWQESSPPRITMNPRALIADDECELLDSGCRTQGRRSASVTTAAAPGRAPSASSSLLSRQIRGPFQGLATHISDATALHPVAHASELRGSSPMEDKRRSRVTATSPQLVPRVADAAVQSMPLHPMLNTSAPSSASLTVDAAAARSGHDNHSHKPATRSASVQCIVDFPLPPPPPQATVSTSKAVRTREGAPHYDGAQQHEQQQPRHRLFAPSSAVVDAQSALLHGGPQVTTPSQRRSVADVAPSASPQPRQGRHTHVAAPASGYRLQAHHGLDDLAADQRYVARQHQPLLGGGAAASSSSSTAAPDFSRIASRNSDAELRHQQRMLKQRLSKQRPTSRVDAVLRSLVSRSSSATSSKTRGPSAYEAVLQEGLPRENGFTAQRTPSARDANRQRRGSAASSRRTSSTASVTSSASEPRTRGSSVADRLAEMYLRGRSTSAASRSVSPSHHTETTADGINAMRKFAAARRGASGTGTTRIRSPAVVPRGTADVDLRVTGKHLLEDSSTTSMATPAAARSEPRRQVLLQTQQGESGAWLSPPPHNARSSVEALPQPMQGGGTYMSPRSEDTSPWPPAVRAVHRRSPSAQRAQQRLHDNASQRTADWYDGEPVKHDRSPHVQQSSSLRASVSSARSPPTRVDRRSGSPSGGGPAVSLSPEALKLHNALLGGRRSHSRYDGTEAVVHGSTASSDTAVQPTFAMLRERPVNCSATSSTSSAVGGKSRFILRQLYQESLQHGDCVATEIVPSTSSRVDYGSGWYRATAPDAPPPAASRSDWWTAAASASFHPQSTAEVSSDLEAASLLGRIAEMKKLMMT